MNFEFATAQRIIFGAGKLAEIGAIAAGAERVAVITGRDTLRAARLLELLRVAGVEYDTFAIEGEPTVEAVARITHSVHEHFDFVIAIGGGSVIDAGKAIAALLTNDDDIFDYLEVIGRGKPLINAPLPFIAIPTTAGTGAEVTRNAVLSSPKHGVKVSLRSPFMLPRVALVDPELTYDLPPALTTSTGLDALTQLIEPFVSHRANPITDALCRDGISRVARSLRRAYENGTDALAREDMAMASLFGGLALANAGLGAVHGFAAPIGGAFPAPHGAVCAALLPHVMHANICALRERESQNPALPRYDEIAQILSGDPNAAAIDGAAWVENLCRDLKTSALSAYGISQSDFPNLIEKAAVASSMQANPLKLSGEELRLILEKAF